MLDELIEFERCRRDPHYFIFNFLKTKDEHDLDSPVKNFPNEDYLHCIVDTMLVSGKIIKPDEAIYLNGAGFDPAWTYRLYTGGIFMGEKSRQIMGSWIVVAYLRWRAKFRPHQLIMVQSKREDDSANLVFNKEATNARLSFLEWNLPRHLRTVELPRGGSYGHLYDDNGSHTWGIPEGGDIIRSNTSSVIFSDEAAFQPEFGAAFTAALPSVKGGGQYICISSAEPGTFQETVQYDKENTPTKIPGLSFRLTDSLIPVMRIHYSADSGKRPMTAAGAKWLEEASSGYAGGINSPRWRKEMEIDYGALSGTKLLPSWDTWKDAGRIVIPPFAPIGYRIYGSYDHGWRNPACYLVHGVSPDGDIVTLWEFYGNYVPVHQIAEIIKGKSITTEDGRRYDGNPFAHREVFKVADPSMWAEDVPQSDNTNKSTAWIFERCGVFFEEGERGGDTTVAEWLLGHFWKDLSRPAYRITNNCKKLIWELGQQRFKQFSDQVALNRDQSEELVDKDNHAWDSMKMFLKRFPPPSAKPKPKIEGGSLQWWIKQNQRASRGLPARTFRVGVG